MALTEPLKLLEGLFIFSLIWSIGATTEIAGRTFFNLFLRKLLKKSVEESPDRTEFDLGPGVTISPPEFDLRPVLPVVSPLELSVLKSHPACGELTHTCQDPMCRPMQLCSELALSGRIVLSSWYLYLCLVFSNAVSVSAEASACSVM